MVDSINNIGSKGFVPVKNEAEQRTERNKAQDERVQEAQRSSDTVEISDEARLAQAQETAQQVRQQLEDDPYVALSGGQVDTLV